MRLLINLCSHDGIVSHFAGVGTIVKRYIETIELLLNKKNIDYEINLITPRYNKLSFGYSKKTLDKSKVVKNGNLVILENGSEGQTAYGTPENWQILCNNAAKYINNIDFSTYDSVITIANDTPFGNLLKLLNQESKHFKIWIPHSTVKIHEVDSALNDSQKVYTDRLKWEEEAIDFINNNENCFLGSTGNYIFKHLVNEYSLKKEKNIYIPNGEIIDKPTQYEENLDCEQLFESIKNEKSLIMSFGRAEAYKNLEATMKLGRLLDIKSVVITKAYFEGQPIIEEYNKLAKETNSTLFVDVPFMFPHYIINHFTKPIILLIPSKREIVGLIINEIRKMNKDNVLIVANDIGGLSEQIESGVDGVLVNLENLEESKEIIKKYFNNNVIKNINKNSQKRLRNNYNFLKTFENLFICLLGDNYE